MKKRILFAVLMCLVFCTAAMAAEEGGGASSEQGIFGGSFADSLWTVISFVLLLAVLSKFAWKPLLASLKNREEHIKQEIELAETSRKRAEQMLDDFKQQGIQLLKEATDRAQQHEQDMVEKTRQEVLAIKQRAQEDIEHVRTAAVEQLWMETGDIVQALSKEVIGRSINAEDNRRLIREAVAKLKQ
jgi:F-type H+-transporting ATPase subunit b